MKISEKEFEQILADDYQIINRIQELSIDCGFREPSEILEMQGGDDMMQFLNENEEMIVPVLKFKIKPEGIYDKGKTMFSIHRRFICDNEYCYVLKCGWPDWSEKHSFIKIIVETKMSFRKIIKALLQLFYYTELKYEITKSDEGGFYDLKFENGFEYRIIVQGDCRSIVHKFGDYEEDEMVGYCCVKVFITKEEAMEYIPKMFDFLFEE